MKISLVQTEIEDAVRAHIRSMISVRDGMDIHMVFSATRGEDGLTAAIDIVPATAGQRVSPKAQALTSTAPAAAPAPAPAAPAARQPAQQPAAQTPEATPTTRGGPFRRQAAAPAQPVAPIAPVSEPEAGPTAPFGEVEDEGEEGMEHEDPNTPEAPAAPATGPKTSIFSGLKRPSHGVPGAHVSEAAEA